jgi:hypothetical protein
MTDLTNACGMMSENCGLVVGAAVIVNLLSAFLEDTLLMTPKDCDLSL